MRKTFFTSLLLVLAILAVSCGEKSDTTSGTDDGTVVYATFADASAAAKASGKHMVLDFYTDW